MDLLKILVVRTLRDSEVEIDARAISVEVIGAEDWVPRVRLSYPLRKLTVTLVSLWSRPDELTLDKITRVATEQAEDFARVSRECDDLEDRLAEVKTATRKAVTAANRRGTAWRLLDVRPSFIETGNDWLPVPEATVEMLNAALRPERISTTLEDPDEVSLELADERLIGVQKLRADRRSFFDEHGAGGAIDAVALAAIRLGGHDPAEIISRLCAKEAGLMLQCGEHQANLHWKDGLIEASFKVADGVTYSSGLYSRGALIVDTDVKLLRKRITAGMAVCDILDLPALQGAIVEKSGPAFGKLEIAIKPRYQLFSQLTCEPMEQLLPI